jgi:Tfp pilus assembly protein PilF
VQPWAASPLLQQALVLEEAGELERAAELAADATANEPSNWRAWIVLSRLAGRLGNSRAAVDAFEEARALNPRSAVFQ